MHFSVFDAYLFDLDGVITPIAEVHMRTWGEMFNAFLAGPSGQKSWTDADYFVHADGKPRYDGVRDFLASRGIELPEGDPSDAATEQSTCDLGNRKNEAFNEIIRRDGIASYPGSGTLIDTLRARDAKLVVVSSSRNAVPVLCAAGLEAAFPVIVDGNIAKEQGLTGKSTPDTFECAAKQLGVEPPRAVVVGDALSGVVTSAAGGFGLAVGVDRGVGPEALRRAGTGLVVAGLGELVAQCAGSPPTR